jgi:outer membrane murein-binding lipoprotein Lpp
MKKLVLVAVVLFVVLLSSCTADEVKTDKKDTFAIEKDHVRRPQ